MILFIFRMVTWVTIVAGGRTRSATVKDYSTLTNWGNDSCSAWNMMFKGHAHCTRSRCSGQMKAEWGFFSRLFPAIKGCAKKPSLVPQLSLKKSKYQYRKESRTSFVWWLRGAVLKRPSALVFGGCDQQSITIKTRQKAFCRVRLNWSAISFDRNEVLKTPYSSDKVVPPQNIAAGKFSSCELYTVMLSIGFNNKRHVKRRMINSWYENGASYFLDDISHRITAIHERK